MRKLMHALCFFIATFFIICTCGPTSVTHAAKAPEITLSPAGYGGGGRFTCVAFEPGNANMVYVGSDVAGFFRSTDQGKSFVALGKDLNGLAVAALAVNPENPSQLAVLTDQGLHISNDKGDTLKLVSEEIRYASRFFGSTLLLYTDKGLLAASHEYGVYLVATDTPEREPESLNGLEGIKVNSLAQFQNTFFAATEEGVYRWTGDTWEFSSEGIPFESQHVMDIAAHPEGALYIVERNTGAYVYKVQKNQWAPLAEISAGILSSDEVEFKTLALNPKDPKNIFLGTHPEHWPHAIFQSTDGGASWEKSDSFHVTDTNENWAKSLDAVESIVFSPAPDLLFLTDWWYVWKSEDNGKSWATLQNGLQNTVINDVKTHPDNPAQIYVAAADNGLMYSPDNGATWQRKMKDVADGNAREVEISTQTPGKLYLLMNPWDTNDTDDTAHLFVYKSLNNGDTWQLFRAPVARRNFDQGYANGLPTNIEIDPANDDVVYVGSNGYGVHKLDTANCPDPENIQPQDIGSGLPMPFISGPGALLVHPKDSKIIYTSTQDGGVYKTTNGGEQWKLTTPEHRFSFGLAMDPRNPERLFAALPEKLVLKTTNGGKSWKEITLPGERPGHVPAYAVAVDANDPKRIYVGTSSYDYLNADGLYLSTDSGEHFTKIKTTLPRAGVFTLTTRKGKCGMLAGYNGLGLYKGCK